MSRVRLIHWKPAEAPARVEALCAAGHEVIYEPFHSQADFPRLREDPGDVAVIDLTRLPSQGRVIGLALRSFRRTRELPLVFAGGDPAKVDRVRECLPDAIYTDWEHIPAALARALSNPPPPTTRPKSLLDGYAGTPLPRKLGLRDHQSLLLLAPPAGFAARLGSLPPGACLRELDASRAHPAADALAGADLLLWFVRSEADLLQGLEWLALLVPAGGMWIAWRKKASGAVTGLDQSKVRRIGLAAGLVDYKICSVDADWSALRFARRKTARR